MSTLKFGEKKPSTGAESAPASVGNGELVREPAGGTGSELATRPDSQVGQVIPPSDGFSGHWDRNDVRLPRINLIHKTSDTAMITKFGIGSFTFNREVKLSDGTAPIIITVLRAAKDYVQKLKFGSPENPAVFNTPEDVEKAGYSLNYSDEKSGKYCGPRAHLQVITALPEGASEEDSALFPYEFEGKSYGMAMLTVASSAYTSVGKELATLCTNNKVMRKGMKFGVLELTSDTKTGKGNTWHVPVIKYAGETPANLVEFYSSLL